MDFTKLDGLVPAVIQDAESGEVLMVGFMNDTALAKTKETGFATFYSRSRQKLWTKGETSGNKLAVQQILVDCDDDTVLVKVKRLGDGNVCHTGAARTHASYRDDCETVSEHDELRDRCPHSSWVCRKDRCRTRPCSCSRARGSPST